MAAMFVGIHVLCFVCFFRGFLETRVVDNTLLRHIFGVFVFPARKSVVARDRSSHRLNNMVRAITDTVTRDLDSDSSLQRVRN